MGGVGCGLSPENIPGLERKVTKETSAKATAGPLDLIVLFDDPLGTSAQGLSVGEAPSPLPLEDLVVVYAEQKRETLATLLGGAANRVVDYTQLPMIAVKGATHSELLALAARPEVAQVFADEPHEHFLTQSLALIDQAGAASGGNVGAGTSVAILDTGVDYANAAFGSCAAAGDPGCKVAFAQDFAADDGNVDDNGHGTNVAAIALGVAPSAKILALDVFRNDGLAYSSDIIAAIDWVVQNRVTYNIQSMNMSLGGGGSTSACGSDVFAAPILAARNAGVLTAAASGNNAYTNRISSPACVPAAVSVGAVYDANLGGIGWSGCNDASSAADKVTCFSNSASFLTVLAPGALITAGGATMGGTSQASPHVAGAIAVLRAAYPNETPAETVSRLTSRGVSVTDARNGVSTPRLALAQALAANPPAPPPPPAPVVPPVDRTAPSGTVLISAGAAATKTLPVTLSLRATDATGVTQMCISNTTACTAWIAYAATKSWTLASGTGVRTVYAQFKDAAGNISARVSDTIIVDTAAPVQGRLTLAASSRQVALSWSGFSDRGSGIARYVLMSTTARSAPANCTSGTPTYSGAATSFAHTRLTGGTIYRYRLCAVDNAGNFSAGVTGQATAGR